MKSINACEEGSWSVLTWKKEDGSNPQVKPFRCRSWRHEGDCRRECAACDFARILSAVESHRYWSYMVYTYPAGEWPNVAELFRAGVIHWSRMRKRLVQRYGEIKYIQTWEIHRSGYPHVNVIVSNKKLWESLNQDWFYESNRVLQPMAYQVGFGERFWVETVKSRAKMSSYLNKLAMELTSTGKFNQIPINAPRHFRRLRASRKLLPPRMKSDEITGCLMRLSAAVVASALDDS